MRITHVVCTAHFAGVESHVAVLAAAQHDLGHTVTVLGGDVARMRTAIDRPGVSVRAVAGILDAVRQLAGAPGREADVVATHMSAADLAAVVSPTLRSTPIVSTRHFAARRGSRSVRRVVLWLVARRLSSEIAVSAHIAAAVEGQPSVVLPGIPERPEGRLADGRDRTVLLVQRLEAEKDTDVGLRAFAASGLAAQGWSLELAGDGAERARLEDLARELGIAGEVTFLGHRGDVDALMGRAGILLATCGVEGLGLAVVEAMASGLPVVASSAGGHLETVGPTRGAALFPVGRADVAARLLADLALDPDRRDTYGAALRSRQRSAFSVSGQAAATEAVYEHAASRPRTTTAAGDHDLVVISLEPWDEVWRRNQHLVAGLLRDDPDLRVLFVEPAADLLHAVLLGIPARPGRGLRRGPLLTGVTPGRLWLYQPTKLLPRRVDPRQDGRWAAGVRRAARRLGLTRPTLWVNDPHGAEVLERTGWPSLYDITDDWLEADRDEATHARLARHEETLMRRCIEVVVCSTGLVRTKSPRRPVTLLRNAVDAEAVRHPTTRPTDLPVGPVAVYVGTLHGDRLDVDLCVATAHALRGVGALVLVGPNALTADEDERLATAGVVRLGGKDRLVVPAYLQHADVLVVPHLVDDFTDSLDPIKLYEYRAVGRVVVSTPVSGFREAAGPRTRIVAVEDFAATVRASLPAVDAFPTGADPTVPTWAERVAQMREILAQVAVADGRVPADVPDLAVPLDVRVRLGHAAVQRLAELHDVDLLHIKGPAIDPSLAHAGRQATDVDVLVRPGHEDVFLRSCGEAGFRLVSHFRTGSPFEHSATLHHAVWGHVDVHRLFPGIGLTPEQAFTRLWGTRTRTLIGGIWCPTPGAAAQAVLLVLHAARTVRGGQATADVDHVWHEAAPSRREAVLAEVAALDAQVAFAAGIGALGSVPDGPRRRTWAAMTQDGGRLREWRARIAAGPDVPTRARLVAMAVMVNTDHLAVQLGRRPTRAEVAREFVARARRGIGEVCGRRGGRR